MLKELIGLATNFAKNYEKGKNQLFSNHVEPLKQNIHQAHDDYLRAFLEARKSLQHREVPASEILDFLEERRHSLAAQRDLTRALAAALQQADRRIVTPNAWQAFQKFSEASLNYFVAADSIAGSSWYTDFIHFMKVSRIVGMESKFFDHNVFGNDPRTDLINHITIIVDKRLPSKLNDVNLLYAELRSSLL